MPDSSRERRCGSCTLCCKVMGIVELKKPGGVRCQHQLSVGGCAIYGAHPQSCREFICVWLAVPEIPHRLRPDLCKVVMDMDATGRRLIAHCDPSNPLAWRREPAFSFLKDFARKHWNGETDVLAKAGLRVWLIGPNDEQDLGEIDPRSPLTIRRFPDGTSAYRIEPPAPLDQAAGGA